MPKKELQFRIEGATPHTLPMSRLAEYLKELAKLLGSEERVHFLRVDDGSANCLMEVDAEYEPVISERVRLAQAGHATKDANKAFKVPEEFLLDDDHSAVMQWEREMS